MSLVNVISVVVGKNPTSLFDGFKLEIVFECLETLDSDLEWKLIYVGSAEDKRFDQDLDCVVMGPLNRGAMRFTFETNGPDFSKIPSKDIHGFTIILLIGTYREQEFIRIGWYVHNVYLDQEMQEEPPEEPILEKMQRVILTDAPRVTRFKISWGQQDSETSPINDLIEDEEIVDEADGTNVLNNMDNDVLTDCMNGLKQETEAAKFVNHQSFPTSEGSINELRNQFLVEQSCASDNFDLGSKVNNIKQEDTSSTCHREHVLKCHKSEPNCLGYDLTKTYLPSEQFWSKKNDHIICSDMNTSYEGCCSLTVQENIADVEMGKS